MPWTPTGSSGPPRWPTPSPPPTSTLMPHEPPARTASPPTVLAEIFNRYRGATAAGISDNTGRAGLAARDALRLARRFRQHETTILRFVVDLAVPWTNN